ncbi:MAG: hypothetical protein NW226_22925 [Microscillaceae bacterium]|nr:hypothetical protein [Microscillaceae bacterium]
MYAYDTGVNAKELAVNTLEKGFAAYHNLIADSYLEHKSADELLEAGNFMNSRGGAYATNPHYEVLLRAKIGNMYRRKTDIKLYSGVGEGRDNQSVDVKLRLLPKLRLITEIQ